MRGIFKIFVLCLISFVFVLIVEPCCTFADDIDYHHTDYEEISVQIQKDIAAYHIPGMAVIVVDADEVLFSETYGNCNSIDTPFIIGSMTKSFTALAVMQLEEQGKINLDAPISDYMDCSAYLKNPSEGERITVRQLLNHTSGLGRYQTFADARITDTYGTHAYSNVGYDILGKVIEAVSGESYENYVDEHIFMPLGMEHSAATLEKSKENGLIAGYRNYFGIPVEGEPDYPDGSGETVAAGYITSSVSDMGKYLQMYINGGNGVITSESIDAMFYDNVPQDDNGLEYYGMGWGYTQQFDQPMLIHSGLVENYTSYMIIFPEKEIGIVVLVNMNDYFVSNNLLGNIIMPLIGEERTSFPDNAYLLFHLLIDMIYLLIIVLAVYPVFSIRRWKTKNKTKGLLILDILRHGLLPAFLLALPYLLNTPYRIIWLFVKDLFFVLTISSVLLLSTGLYKIIFDIKTNCNVCKQTQKHNP